MHSKLLALSFDILLQLIAMFLGGDRS